MSDDDEPTWGDSVPSQISPAPKPVPNQRSMPVVGSPAPPAQPHSPYQRPAAQHYPSPPPAANPASYPVIPPSTNYPVVNPVAYPLGPQPTFPGTQPPATYPAAPYRDSFVSRLMQRGVRGELLRQPWFQDVRLRNADVFIYVTFGVGVVLSLMLTVIPSSFVVTVLTTSLWAGIAYTYFALGTKLAHQFTLFGICLVGGLLMAVRALVSMVALSAASGRYYGFRSESVAELSFVLLINLAGVAALVYLGVQVHRGIQQMSQP